MRLWRLPATTSLTPQLGAVGRDETERFKEWTADLVASWCAHGGEASHLEIPGSTHFTVFDRTAEPDGEIMRAITGLVASQ
jgi:hypothetical protein